jgi:hypothetical protein
MPKSRPTSIMLTASNTATWHHCDLRSATDKPTATPQSARASAVSGFIVAWPTTTLLITPMSSAHPHSTSTPAATTTTTTSMPSTAASKGSGRGGMTAFMAIYPTDPAPLSNLTRLVRLHAVLLNSRWSLPANIDLRPWGCRPVSFAGDRCPGAEVLCSSTRRGRSNTRRCK